MTGVGLYLGDCREVMAAMDAASVDAVVTDPPYELGFMGRAWDASGIAYDPVVWRECLRVLRPGGHLVAFGGTRTYHRLACAVEDAGFEIRDSLHWVYGSGFPKSQDVGKAIDKAAGAEREATGRIAEADKWYPVTAPVTPAAARWDGWGTALKPAHEPIILARKPLAGTVATNVLEHGTGALNVNGCRVGMSESDLLEMQGRSGARTAGDLFKSKGDGCSWEPTSAGRWPPNVLLGPEAAAELDVQSGMLKSGSGNFINRSAADQLGNTGAAYGAESRMTGTEMISYGDSGGASRFYPQFSYTQHDLAFFPVESDVCGDAPTTAASMSAGKRTDGSDGNSPTGGPGNRNTDLSLTDAKSTTGTTTRSTTTRPTSCASPPSGTTTTTSGYGNSTDGSAELSNGDASDARNGSRSPSTTSAVPEPGRGTASPASGCTGASGSRSIGTGSTPRGGHGERPDSVPEFFPVFRYQAKAPRSERPAADGVKAHPTVKPVALMRWLVRLVTPPGGLVLDPFAGTGTTGEACLLESFSCVLIERDPDYVKLARVRLAKPIQPQIA